MGQPQAIGRLENHRLRGGLYEAATAGSRPTRLLATACVALLFLPSPAPAAEFPRGELRRAIGAVVNGGPLAAARSGIFVADVESGEVVYEKDADALLNPASNVKLVTSAAALARLGPEFRFATELYVDARSSQSPMVKTLYVKGMGDPSLVTERLWAIAWDLYHLGLRRVGELVVDESFFDGERIGPGFDQESGDKSYLAKAGAASLNWNTIAVHVSPGERPGAKARVELEPPSALFELQVRAVTGPAGARRYLTIASTVSGARQRLVVSGVIPFGSRSQVLRRRVEDPGLYLGQTLKGLLELRGVKTAKVRLGSVPKEARLIHVAESDSLGEIVRRLNKTSNNFVAEQLLKTLGAQLKGAPGSWQKGVQATEELLAEAGIPRGSYVMRNGSGLNDTNRFSARQLVTLLRAMWARFPLHAEYLTSLPVAGRDGTIRWRMEGSDAEGRLRAKTGTLDGVTALSGYVESAGKRTLAFSIIVNDVAGRPTQAVRSVDAIGVALASGGLPAGPESIVKSAPAQPSAAPADMAAALRTYYGLGRSGDARNLQLLRTALRAEQDPAMRLALGECVYLSDPDGESSRRTFIEALPQDVSILARLWAAAGGDAPGAQIPVLSSLGDLAADGDEEALARLVDLSPAAALDRKLGATMADVMAGVALALPGALIAALRAAAPPVQEAAIGALGAGLAREDRRQPFMAALRVLGEGTDEQGAFARSLGPRLDAAAAAGSAARTTVVPASGSAPARAPGGG